MVDKFLERGFTYFDTAYMYHDFKSEETAKKIIVDRHPRDSFTLTSKLPTMMLKQRMTTAAYLKSSSKTAVLIILTTIFFTT